ncbi:hybrid sensor histidine kinase/response regulator [Mangrovivirga sp. M17]|uniref:histidine kinase n=1 Tax=Mangrovivirga halotolerans TaxID=2993936 RepID=A0ABT3RRR3_9BACT|nr:hybrid sensor histidine kinase/response regulator [Mangrovivirga halotolerans]MCX2744243.1 hybrid sensor histidine kinase/response regulator [Mangrovivirga halotolerans]
MQETVNILLVEDEEAHAELIKRFLERSENFNVLTVYDLKSAIKQINNNSLDLIITDYLLPDGDGTELIKFKGNTETELPVILMTSQGDEHIAVEAIKKGAIDYVVKSESVFQELPRIVNRTLREWSLVKAKKEADKLLTKQYHELQKTNQELDRFVYSASHDLSAPLKSLLGLINVAKLDTKDDQMIQYLQLMEKSVHKLDEFIVEIINFSRNTRQEIEYEKINLEDLINSIIDNQSFNNNFEKIEFKVSIPDELKIITCDQLRLKIILNNLISNAIKFHAYHRNEIPYIKIDIYISSDQEKVIIEIEDNGTGIEKGHLDKIFDMFYRGSDINNGSGLGLYIVKEALIKIHGNISVTSRTNRGTTFFVELPADELLD